MSKNHSWIWNKKEDTNRKHYRLRSWALRYKWQNVKSWPIMKVIGGQELAVARRVRKQLSWDLEYCGREGISPSRPLYAYAKPLCETAKFQNTKLRKRVRNRGTTKQQNCNAKRRNLMRNCNATIWNCETMTRNCETLDTFRTRLDHSYGMTVHLYNDKLWILHR